MPADDIDQRVAAVAALLRAAGPSFTYVYWPELDRVGHEFGVASREWRLALQRADALVAPARRTRSSREATLVVTADHGMVDCPADMRIDIEANPLLMAGVRRVAGEPRARHLYVTAGSRRPTCRRPGRQVLGDRALVLRRDELVARRLLRGRSTPASRSASAT